MDFINEFKLVSDIVGTLCAFGATSAFAANPISLTIAKQWYYKDKLSQTNRFTRFFFNIWSRNKAMDIFTGGNYTEIETKTDTQAPVRGFIWAFLATVFIIFSLV